MGFPVPLLNQRRSGIPGIIKANARALYHTKAGGISGSLLLDQSPLNSGTRRTGEEGRCYLYDGVNDYSAFDSEITLSGDFSLSFWINMTSPVPSFQYIAQKDISNNRIFFTLNNRITVGINNFINLDTNIVAGSDYHITLSRSSGVISFYVNGVLQSSALNYASDIVIARLSSNLASSTYALDSYIWDIRRYNKALTQNEVNFVYSFGETGTDPSLPVNWWKCDEQSGTIGYDSVGGNHLTHNNITAGTFHATQDIWSFQNQVGFNLKNSMIQNGSFDTDSIWVKEGGVVISGGVGVFSGASSQRFRQDVLTIGETYKVTFDIVDYTSGTLSVQFGTTILGSFTSSGTHEVTGTATGATLFAIRSNTVAVATIDNVIVEPVTERFYIPRDESDPTNDVLGNPLTNTGRRPNDAALHSSNCLTADGTLYIAAAHLAGTETVVSSGGTSTPSISAGRIDFTAGTCWDLTLSDGTHYPLSEGGGIGIHDDSGSGNHGILTNAVLASAWGGSQDDYHSNLIDGSGKRMWFDGVNDYVNFGSVGNLGVNCKVQFDFITTDSGQVLFSQRDANRSCVLYQFTSSNTIGFYNSNGNIPIWIGTPNGIDIRDAKKHTLLFEKTGNDLSITIDGYTVSVTKAFADSGNIGDFAVGGHPNEISEFEGVISNVKVDAGNTGTWDLESNGYGNTDSDWIDITGNGNDGTVVGSPEAFYIPAAPNGLDVFGNELTEKPSDTTRNRAETLVDLDPDSTPEMGATQLGITVPASHAFGDAFAASDQIFSRQRTLTEDRFVVMPEAQTGSALATIQKYTQP